MHPSPQCVVEIRTEWPDGKGRLGSGYLVADGWVLTAAHVVRGATSIRVWIGPQAMLELEGEAIVHADRIQYAAPPVDAALIPISGHTLPDGYLPAVHGFLDRDVTETVMATALGLPSYKLREAGDESVGLTRELAAVGGTIIPAADRLIGTLAMNVVGGPDRATQETSESVWAGMSGAAVWAAGHVIGVVAKHHVHEGASALTVWPLSTDDADPWLSVVPQLGTAADVTPDSLGELVPATYVGVAAELAPALLTGRVEELAQLDAFAAGTERWWWYSADAFSGKTALTAWWVSNYRQATRAAVVACFLRSVSNLDTADYAVRSLSLQLAAVAQWSDQEVSRLDLLTGDAAIRTFTKLVDQAAARCVAEGRRLVVVVDGLDEYQAVRQVPIEEWLLKARLPDGAALLVTSRAGAPSRVPQGHPLYEHVHALEPSETAARILRLADAEIDRAALADPNGLTHQILGFHAAAEGPLTHSELAGLIRRQHRSDVYADQIETTWKLHLARTITPAPGSASGFGFAHEQLRAKARIRFADRLPDYRRQLREWAREYAGKGWPTDTPGYLLRAYTTMLSSCLSSDAGTIEVLDQLYEVVSSPRRWMALFLADGSPVLPDEEIVQTQHSLVMAYERGLIGQSDLELRLATLGLSRGPVRGSLTYPAAGVAVIWALLGEGDKAMRLAQAIREPDGRTYALGAIALAAAAAGDTGLMDRALGEARSAELDAGPYRERLQVHLALRLAKAARFGAAKQVALRISDIEKMAKCLADVALLAARAGEGDTTRALAAQVAELAVKPGAEGHKPLGVLAEAFAVLGDGDQSASCFSKAYKLTDSARFANERKYLHWARRTVETAWWRARATIAAMASDDPLAALSEEQDVHAWLELPAYFVSDHQAWNMANVGAVITLVRGPAAARDLAEKALAVSVENAESHDQEADWIGSTPYDLVCVLLEAGLEAPVIAALQNSSMGDGWRAARESIRAQLVRYLAAKGADTEAAMHSAHLAHLGYGTSRTEIIAAAAVEALGTDRWEQYRDHARSQVEAEFGRMVADERTARLLNVRRQIEAYLAGDASPMPGGPEPLATRERIDSDLAAAEDPLSPLDEVRRSELVEDLAQWFRDYATTEPADAKSLLPRVRQVVDDALKPFGFAWFKAQRRLVEAQLAWVDRDAARRQAEAMIEPLTAMDFLDPSCFADTLAALHATGALTDATAAPLVAMVAQAPVDDSSERRAIAVHFAQESVDGPAVLAESAADLITRRVPSPEHWFANWYKPALEVLAGLVAGGHSLPARQVADALLRQGIRADVLWTDRAAILGGLVKSNEPTVRDEALRRLTVEDAFIDEVTDLPVELLHALLRTVFTD